MKNMTDDVIEMLTEEALAWRYQAERYRNAQAQVADCITRRGYREGWTAEQFLARQLAKMMEELGEAASNCRLPDDYIGASAWEIAIAAGSARADFDDKTLWQCSGAKDPDALESELADMQVVLFAMADALAQIKGKPVDIVELAVDKARQDIGRGVRSDTQEGTETISSASMSKDAE